MKIEWNGLVCMLRKLFLKPRNGHGSPEKVTWNRKPMEAGWIDVQIYIFYMTCVRGNAGFQVLLSSWGKGHRQAVFTPVAQQVAVESRKTLEADLPDCSDCSLQMFKRLGHFEI